MAEESSKKVEQLNAAAELGGAEVVKKATAATIKARGMEAVANLADEDGFISSLSKSAGKGITDAVTKHENRPEPTADKESLKKTPDASDKSMSEPDIDPLMPTDIA